MCRGGKRLGVLLGAYGRGFAPIDTCGGAMGIAAGGSEGGHPGNGACSE